MTDELKCRDCGGVLKFLDEDDDGNRYKCQTCGLAQRAPE